MSANDKLKSDAEYQRRCVMSHDERCIDARDRVAKNIHEQNMRDGKNTTYDSALRKATEVANRVHREKGEK